MINHKATIPHDTKPFMETNENNKKFLRGGPGGGGFFQKEPPLAAGEAKYDNNG
jgi:hypothetical protein